MRSTSPGNATALDSSVTAVEPATESSYLDPSKPRMQAVAGAAAKYVCRAPVNSMGSSPLFETDSDVDKDESPSRVTA